MEITLEKSRMENPEQLATLGPKTEKTIQHNMC
jgi:hypothetical protein